MKTPWSVSVLILLVCGGFGWREQAAISAVAADNERLRVQADELEPGVAERSGKAEAARALAARYVNIALMQEASKGAERAPDEAKEFSESTHQLLEMDAAQLKIVVMELLNSPRLDDSLRSDIVSDPMAALAESDPSEALAIFFTYPESFRGDVQRDATASALALVAEKSPREAMDWIRKVDSQRPELIGEWMQEAVGGAVAKSDVRLAFSLIDELGFHSKSGAGFSIARASVPRAGQTAVLAALREYLAGSTDEAKADMRPAVLCQLAMMAVPEGYEKAAAWLESASLSPEEARDYSQGIDRYEVGADAGKWIAWMGARLRADDDRYRVESIMREWTIRDRRAAESWLKEQPEGPAREIAAGSYAITLAPYQPEAAAQWAQSLPDDWQRERVIRNVYRAWTGKDPAAARAFARRNGLGER